MSGAELVGNRLMVSRGVVAEYNGNLRHSNITNIYLMTVGVFQVFASLTENQLKHTQ